MIRIKIGLVLLAIVSIAYSQAPQSFNYQAVLRDNFGKVLENQSVEIQLEIVQSVVSGLVVYTEDHNEQTNEFGLINLAIGTGSTTDNFSSINWASYDHYLRISVDNTVMSTSKLLSVPYALYAASGNEGPQGPPGLPGLTGDTGPIGPAGPKGDKGDAGDTGPQGVQGPQGEEGPQGEQGLQGEQGEQGDTGETGPPGSEGPQGVPGDTRWDEVSGGINYADGNVGIGTITPEFKLSLDNDGSILAVGEFNSGATLPISPSGSNLIWYPRKAAFRAGWVEGHRWDDEYIGNYSSAFGYDNYAIGDHSTAMGVETTSSGLASTSMGGWTRAAGDYSTALGHLTRTDSYGAVVIGQYNTNTGGSSDTWSVTNPLFIIGNGIPPLSPGNAMLVRKDGRVYFPDVYGDIVTGRDLYIASDGQIGYISSSSGYKSNISSMEDISWIYDLNPVNFKYNSDETETKQYGLIAEEVEEVNPSFVSYNEEGVVETVSYSQLISPMIKALQEQNKIIEELQARIEALESN